MRGHQITKPLIFALLAITAIVLSIDWVGVRIVNQNGLAFRVHCYSYGSTFALATIISFLFLRRGSQMARAKSSVIGALIAGVWWLVTFVLLLYFHGLIGGWY